MLSIENPPLDPHQNSTNDDDDVDRINASSQIQEVVDLCKPDFDSYHNNTTIHPPPRFSIRDYVCSARSKNIATNWPFSEKNLQLCQKHGVTDLLPPFQSLDSVREQSVKGWAVNHNFLDQEDLSNPDEKTTSVSGQGEGENPSEVEQSHSKKDTQAAFLLDSSPKQVAGAILPETRMTDFKIQREPSVKKSKVILKLGTSANTSTKEGTTNSFMVSEIMGSKVCPICKTFLSSSNTTLNAHIDQCLSGESTMKWSADPRVIKHRIKPRKMRSMVDIYTTAEHCTLEDLDRRNGTNWAMIPTPFEQSGELCVKERVEKMSSGGIEDTGHEEGEVYIDANGKKVRILSKFSEAAPVDWITRAQKGDKGSKLLIDKKQKKPYVLKHQKFLKRSHHGKPCSSKPNTTLEARGGSSRNIAVDQPSEKEVKLGECSKGQEPIKLDDSGIIRQWVGSKRTGLKKIPRQDNHQHSGHNLKDLVDERDRSSFSNSYAGSNCILNRQQSFKDFVSPKCSKRMESSSNEPHIGLCREQPPLKRKREESFLSCEGPGFGKRSAILQKHKNLRNEGTTLRDSCNSILNRSAPGSSSLNKKAVEINTTPTRTSDSFVFVSKSSCRHKAFSSKATKFTSTRRRHLLTNQGTVTKFGSDFKRKSSAPTRFQVNRKLERNSNFVRTISLNNDDHPDFTDKQSKVSNFTAKMSNCQTRVLRIRKHSGADKISRKEEALDCSKNSPSEPPYHDHVVDETNKFSPVDYCRSLDNSEDSVDGEKSNSEDTLAIGNHVTIGETFKEGIGGSFKSSSNSLDPEFDELPSSFGENKSEHYAEVNQRHSRGHPVSPTEPSDNGKQELFSTDRFGHVMVGEDIHMEAQLDSEDKQVNYFFEVDSIPIPGPPGSFLPSPRHMGSDDLQGSSSLTTCRIQFTEDQHDHVERDKSDSPTSASSDISNPASAISESKSPKSFSIEPLAVHNKIIEGCADASPVLQAANVGADLPNKPILRINEDFPKETPVSSKSEQLCCCSRKEGVQGVPLNFQESQLQRRRIISSLPFLEKHVGNDYYERLGNMNSRSEMFSLSNHPTSGSGTLIHPLRESVSEHIDTNFFAEHEFKFSSHQRDHDSASPSASTPVLRLMGKNLMVLNKDEDVYLQHRQNHSNSMDPQPHLESSTFTEFFPGGVGSKDYHSYHQVNAEDPVAFSPDQRQDAIGKQLDADFLYKRESRIDVKTPSTAFNASGLNLRNTAADACKTPMEQHEYKGGSCMLSVQPRPKKGPNYLPTHGLGNKFATLGAKRWDLGSTSSRDIIIIDDATDIKADSAIGMMCNEGMRKTPVSLYGNSVLGASDLSTRFANPICSNALEGAGFMYGRQPILQNTSFQLPNRDGTTATPVKWNCNPEGVSLLSPSTLGALSSSPGHPRPKFYVYPSFS
ncbi:uncharacterized protein LOC141713343 [Apium graveolens]|uniref:uncharacterized protein LOC141713343 n=1 Tax=Apium graveolens TaxID=4045 RepID=UPI003D7915AD